jgi:hypothetical protein
MPTPIAPTTSTKVDAERERLRHQRRRGHTVHDLHAGRPGQRGRRRRRARPSPRYERRMAASPGGGARQQHRDIGCGKADSVGGERIDDTAQRLALQIGRA